MKTSKKLILGTLLTGSTLFADVTTLLPYTALLQYDSSANVSAKDKGSIVGMYFSHGNLDYLFEFDYARTNISYKLNTDPDLVQDDITVAYSRYYESFFVKGGVHYIGNTDLDMGDGLTFMATVGGYQWQGYDKISYALDTYYAQYKDGYNDTGIKSEVAIVQLSPNFTYSKAINTDTRNNLHLKLNYQITNDYLQDNYVSYEIQDTLYYKSFFANAKFIGGEMISGVRDNGYTAFNTKDVIKNSYGVKLGYYFNPSNLLTIGYDVNNYQEYSPINAGYLDNGSFSVASFTYTYTY